jgi:cation diffusion facilitator family transporter
MASSKLSIYAALAANLLIAVTKFVAGAISNSAAMIAEGVHSVVDTVNELLLLLGLHRSKKQPDPMHPFGYGKELYFWSFIVSIMIFGLGGGVSIYQGVTHIIHPEKMGDPTINYIVLSLSIIFEGTSLFIALKQFNQVRGATPWWEAVVKSKDPSSFLVLFEDAAAVAGLFIVITCVYLSHKLNLPYLDGVASLLVGLILVIVSSILARESRSLLMGEGVSTLTKEKICSLVEGDDHVVKVQHILSTYQSPSEVLLMLIVAFKEDLDTEEINVAIDRIRDTVKAEFKLVRFVIIQPESLDHHLLWNDDKH